MKNIKSEKKVKYNYLKYFNKVLFLLVFLIFISTSSASSVPKSYDIRVVNMDVIYSSLPEVDIIQKKIQAEADSLRSQLEKKYKEFERQGKALQGAGRKISDKIRIEREEKLMKLRDELGRLQQEMRQKINAKQMELMAPIYKKIEDAIHKYGKSLGISIFLLQSRAGTKVICLNKEFECTNQILHKLKKAKSKF